MARDFSGSTSSYIEAPSAVVTGYPFSVSCWFNPDAVGNSFLVLLTDASESAVYQSLIIDGALVETPEKLLATSRNAGAPESAVSAADVVTGAWQHGGGVWSSDSSRAVFLNGAKATNSATVSFGAGTDTTTLGRLTRPSPVAAYDGRMAEVGVWNVALTDAEMAMLAAGYSPLTLTHRIPNLVFYQDLIRDINRPGIGPAVTSFSTSVADHPRVLYPRRRMVAYGAAGEPEPANTAPVANDDIANTAYETPVVISVLSNDTDSDLDTLSIDSFTQGSNGTVTDNGDGTLTYTPDTAFSGADSFTYVVSDGDGGTDTGTVNVTVGEEPNAAPVANDDTASTAYETAVVVSVLTNDTDDNDAILSIDSFTQGANGTVTDNGDGSLTYTPGTGFSGEDTFTYTVTDGTDTDTATVTVTVGAAPDPDPPGVDVEARRAINSILAALREFQIIEP